jgi:Mlc titration factor MtfA (ptsG expression regulator)
MVLHEMSHGYHQNFIPDGYQNREIKTAYEHAIRTRLYDLVLRANGREIKAYAATNDREYFAEATEAFFGTNDFFPSVQAELRRHDPMACRLLQEAWGVAPEAAN